MKDLIRKRLTEYRTEAMDSIGVAVNRTKSKAAGTGNLNSSKVYLAINEDNKAGFEAYMDRSMRAPPITTSSQAETAAFSVQPVYARIF